MMFRNTTIAALLLWFSFFTGCKDGSNILEGEVESGKQVSQRPELLIYCGITMIAPMIEIAEMIEDQNNCRIRITKGGSGNLLKSILHNQTGDLYLPGSERYYTTIESEHPGLVTGKVFVGVNQAALLVKKGNPHEISSDLSCLTDPRFGVILGNPESGSIGKETKYILERAGIFEDVINNALLMATDSKDILKYIKNDQADVGINWIATTTWDDNGTSIEAIPISAEYASPKKLFLGKLKYTQYPEICDRFMEVASSPKGNEIFRKHGLFFD